MNISRFFACVVGSLYNINDSSKYKCERVDLVPKYFFEIYLFLLVGVEEHASGIVCYRRFLSPDTIWLFSNELTY